MTPAEKKAVEAVVRAAKACLDKHGFMYQNDSEGLYPIKPVQMRRLENALAKLKEQEAKREKRRGK